MKVLCIIPVFNEEHRLKNLLNQLNKFKYEEYNLKYLFINNGSQDSSKKIIHDSQFAYLNFKKNMGIGYALMLGYIFAIKYNYNIVIHLAGNGKMNPAEIIKFLDAIIHEKYDFVNGSRFLEGSSKKNNPIYRIIMIRFFSFFLNIFLKNNITDATCGFRAFKVNLLSNFKKTYFKKELFTYGYEYFSFGKIISNKKVKFKEIAVGMNYPSKKNYTKIKPFTDWYIILKYWIKGLFDRSPL